MKEKKQMSSLVIVMIIFILANLCFLKYFNLSWVETTESGARITINFLLPMNQEAVNNHLSISSSIKDSNQFSYSLNWINNHVVEINIMEKNQIKGQKIKLLITNAPTLLGRLKKSDTIRVQFKTKVELLSPVNELLVSSSNPFVVQFNTPMDLKQMSKYVQCNTKFYIKPYEITLPSNKKYIDQTKFLFVPKKQLENGQQYVLLFKAGMRSQGGSLLKSDQAIILQVDSKPTISKTYPNTGDKWIGLYPCLTLESKEPIIQATATINNQTIKGTLSDAYHAYFLLDYLLEPETTYQIYFQTQVASGELSEVKTVDFSTTTLNDNRFWIEIHCESEQVIKCYQGNDCIKTIPCQIGTKDKLLRFGTYYLQNKNEVYEDNTLHIGANYWMGINETFGIHGQLRNAYWEILRATNQIRNISISDEDAAWLYEKMGNQTMIIVRK